MANPGSFFFDDQKGAVIFDIDGTTTDIYRDTKAPRKFDNGDFSPFYKTARYVSSEARDKITEAVRSGRQVFFVSNGLSTSFRGNKLPFTQHWGPEGSDEYSLNLHKFQSSSAAAKSFQFQKIVDSLPYDVAQKLNATNNLVVVHPDSGMNKVDALTNHLKSKGIALTEDLKSRFTIYDDEQKQVDIFKAAGFTDANRVIPRGFTPSPFNKDPASSFFPESRGYPFAQHRDVTYARNLIEKYRDNPAYAAIYKRGDLSDIERGNALLKMRQRIAISDMRVALNSSGIDKRSAQYALTREKLNTLEGNTVGIGYPDLTHNVFREISNAHRYIDSIRSGVNNSPPPGLLDNIVQQYTPPKQSANTAEVDRLWGQYQSIVVSPTDVQALRYADSTGTISDFVSNLEHHVESTEMAAAIGRSVESRFNEALKQTFTYDNFHAALTGGDFSAEDDKGVTHTFPVKWNRQTTDDVADRLSGTVQQYRMTASVNTARNGKNQSTLLTGIPDYMKFYTNEDGKVTGVDIIDMKTFGTTGNEKGGKNLVDKYRYQLASYAYLAKREFGKDVAVRTGILGVGVNKNGEFRSISFNPAHANKEGEWQNEDYDSVKKQVHQMLGTFYHSLALNNAIAPFVNANAGRGIKNNNRRDVILSNKIGPNLSSSEYNELMGADQKLDVADITGDNPPLTTGNLKNLEGNAALDRMLGRGGSGTDSALSEVVAHGLEATGQQVGRMADALNRATARREANRYIKHDTIKSWIDEGAAAGDPTYHLDKMAQALQLDSAYLKNGDLDPTIDWRMQLYEAEEAARIHKKELSAQEAEDKRQKKLQSKLYWRSIDNKFRRDALITGRIADLGSHTLMPGQLESISKLYNEVDTTSDASAPDDAQNFRNALKEVDRALREAERSTTAWLKTLTAVTSVLNQPWYNGEQLAHTASSGLGQMHSSASGIIPARLRGVTGHTTRIGQDIAQLWWDENYNLKYKAVETARPVYTSILSTLGTVGGGIIGGPAGAIAGGSLMAGFAGIPSFVSQVKGNIAERNLKTAIGHADVALNIMSIFGELAKNILSVPIKLFTNALKVTAGALSAGAVLIHRYMKQGLDSLQNLGNPVRSLSGISGYRAYQGLGFADTFLGLQKGTSNSASEAFGRAQANLYTLGQFDENRLISSALLGVFGDVYGNHDDPEAARVRMINKLARDMTTADARGRRNIMARAADIGEEIPQTLQVMYEMGITDFNKIKQPPRVYWRGIGDAERGAFRWTNAEWQATQEMLGITKSRIATRIWNRVGRGFYNGISNTGDLISQGHWKNWVDDKGVEHDGALNTLAKTFSNAVRTIREWWDESELSDAIKEFLTNAIDSVRKWISGLDVGELASTLSGKIADLLGGMDWEAIMQGPMKGILSIISGIGKYIENTFINTFNALRGIRFDLKEFILSGGKKGITMGWEDASSTTFENDKWLYLKKMPKDPAYLSFLDPNSVTNEGYALTRQLKGGMSVEGIYASMAAAGVLDKEVGKYVGWTSLDPDNGRSLTGEQAMVVLLNRMLGWNAYDPWKDASAVRTLFRINPANNAIPYSDNGFLNLFTDSTETDRINSVAANAAGQLVEKSGSGAIKERLEELKGTLRVILENPQGAKVETKAELSTTTNSMYTKRVNASVLFGEMLKQGGSN